MDNEISQISQEIVTSESAQIIFSVVPIVGIVIGGITILFYLLWRHHEIKLQIKTGTFVPAKFNLKIFSLLAGLLLTAIGIMLTVVFAIADGFKYSILAGLLPLAMGLSLLLFYKIYPEFHKENDTSSNS